MLLRIAADMSFRHLWTKSVLNTPCYTSESMASASLPTKSMASECIQIIQKADNGEPLGELIEQWADEFV